MHHFRGVQNTGPTTFMSWFQEHRESLLTEYPDATPADLTKHGMRRFKAISAESSPTTVAGSKRKLSAEEGKTSGVSKLAKFGFSKQ